MKTTAYGPDDVNFQLAKPSKAEALKQKKARLQPGPVQVTKPAVNLPSADEEKASLKKALALYGFEDAPSVSLVASLYGMSTLDHTACSLTEFCRNPLHPGPCKGWKKTLAKVAPGALKAIEEARLAKVKAKQLAKTKAKVAAKNKIHAAPRGGGQATQHPLAKKQMAVGFVEEILNPDKAVDKAAAAKLTKAELTKHAEKRAAMLAKLAAKYAGKEDAKAYKAKIKADILAALQKDNASGATGEDSEYAKLMSALATDLAFAIGDEQIPGDGDGDGKAYEALTEALGPQLRNALLTGDTNEVDATLAKFKAAPLASATQQLKIEKKQAEGGEGAGGAADAIPKKPPNQIKAEAAGKAWMAIAVAVGAKPVGFQEGVVADNIQHALDNGKPVYDSGPMMAKKFVAQKMPNAADLSPKQKKALEDMLAEGVMPHILDGKQGITPLMEQVQAMTPEELSGFINNAAGLEPDLPPGIGKPEDVAEVAATIGAMVGFSISSAMKAGAVAKLKAAYAEGDFEPAALKNQGAFFADELKQSHTPPGLTGPQKAKMTKAIKAEVAAALKSGNKNFKPGGILEAIQKKKELLAAGATGEEANAPILKALGVKTAKPVAPGETPEPEAVADAVKAIAKVVQPQSTAAAHNNAAKNTLAIVKAAQDGGETDPLKAPKVAATIKLGVSTISNEHFVGLDSDQTDAMEKKLKAEMEEMISTGNPKPPTGGVIAAVQKIQNSPNMPLYEADAILAEIADSLSGAPSAPAATSPADIQALAHAGFAYSGLVNKLVGPGATPLPLEALQAAKAKGPKEFAEEVHVAAAHLATDIVKAQIGAMDISSMHLAIAGPVIAAEIKAKMLDPKAKTPMLDGLPGLKAKLIAGASAAATMNGWDADSPMIKGWKEATYEAGLLKLVGEANAGKLDEPSEAVTDALPESPAAPAVVAQAVATAKATKPTAASGPISIGQAEDISHIDTAEKKKMLASFKAGPAPYLESPDKDVFDSLVAVAAAYGSDPKNGPMSLLQAVQVVDEQHSKNLGVANAGMLQAKVQKWLATPVGAEYAKANTVAKPHLVGAIKGTVTLPSGEELPEGVKVQALGGPGPMDSNLKASDFHPHTYKSARDQQSEYMAKSGTGWSAAEIAGLKVYSGSSYHQMNGWLRGEIATISPKLKQDIVNAQAGMRPLQSHHLLLRGTGWAQLPEGFRDPQAVKGLVGKTFADQGLVSSTVAGAKGVFSGAVRMEIEAPAGTMGAFIEDITQVKGENEMLLASGTKFQVISVGGSSPTVIRVRVVSE